MNYLVLLSRKLCMYNLLPRHSAVRGSSTSILSEFIMEDRGVVTSGVQTDNTTVYCGLDKKILHMVLSFLVFFTILGVVLYIFQYDTTIIV